MDPSQSANMAIPPITGYMFAPGIFLSPEEGDQFLSSLDSDTRDYVLKHTDELRTRRDIDECIARLRNES